MLGPTSPMTERDRVRIVGVRTVLPASAMTSKPCASPSRRRTNETDLPKVARLTVGPRGDVRTASGGTWADGCSRRPPDVVSCLMVVARRSVIALLFALSWLLAATATAATTTDTTTTVTTTTTATNTHTDTTTTTVTQPATTETTTVTSTASSPSHTTTINQTTSVAPSSGGGTGSGVPGWVWVLIGLGAVGVAIAAYMLGRSSGARSEYEAQQRAAAAAGAPTDYPPGSGRNVPPRRPPPPPDWPQS